ncbi:MAG: tetratricopeptide repeat protein [Desulfuromonadaceae bacterium]
MNTTGRLIFVILTLLALMANVYAQSPREELQQLVEQLRKTPGDNALREKIIKHATSIKPAPVIPEEANRPFVKGNVFQKEAKDASGYALAISAYREALRVAPWWGDAYFNLSVALETAGKLDEAIASIRNYMASVPAGSAEAREAQNKIYALEAKKEMAAAKKSPSLAGNWKVFVNGRPQRAGESSGTGSWIQDFHYRFEVKGEEIVAYMVSDSDPILDSFNKTWCRRAGGVWSCTGDEDMFGRFSVDSNVIRGRYLINNLNGNLFGTIRESEIGWDYEYKDQYGVHRNHETLRKQD